VHYIIQILAVILIGISIGALLSRRNSALSIGSIVAIVLGITTIVTGLWEVLAVGLVVYLVVQFMQRDPVTTKA